MSGTHAPQSRRLRRLPCDNVDSASDPTYEWARHGQASFDAEKPRHSAGWYAGALVFWLALRVCTVGLSSIIPQIFWPAGDVRNDAQSCGVALRELRHELLARASQHIAHPPSAPERTSDRDALLTWFDHWDERLFRARPACTEDERAAWTELGRLRHGMQALIERFEREEAPRIERLEQLLGKSEEARAQPRKEPTP